MAARLRVRVLSFFCFFASVFSSCSFFATAFLFKTFAFSAASAFFCAFFLVAFFSASC